MPSNLTKISRTIPRRSAHFMVRREEDRAHLISDLGVLGRQHMRIGAQRDRHVRVAHALPLALAALGLAVVAASYRRDRSFWLCLLAPHLGTRAIRLVQVMVAVTFYGLALQ